MFSGLNDQGVKFIIEGHILRKGVLKQGLKFTVGEGVIHQTVPVQNPIRVTVHDKDRSMGGIEEDAVGGLRADPFDR
jgi:hypothetical protein